MTNSNASALFVSAEAKEGIRRRCEEFRSRIAVPIESVDLATSFGNTHVAVAGPGEAPPLVVLHGALASSVHLLPELGPLLRTHRVYAVDVMGQSVLSEDRRLEVRDDSYGRWLREVVDGLNLPLFDLYGVSWGGFVALRGARAMPDRVRHLVLMVPAGVVGSPFWKAMRAMGWPLMMYLKFPSEARRERLMRALFTTQDPHWTEYMGEAFQAYRLDMRVPPLAKEEEMGAVKCPTLVFAAEEDASFPGEALLARVRQILPQAETELLRGSKHSPPMTEEFRNRTGRRIERFLQDTPSSA
ncbi:MAG: alpha/beta fold hydrolase [Fimbriimonas sp.]